MVLRLTFRHAMDRSTIVESDLLVCTRRAWKRQEESHDPTWSAIRVGPTVFALRLCGIPRLLGVNDAAQPTHLRIPPSN